MYWLVLLACVVGDEVEDGRALVGEVDEELLKKLEADPVRDLSADPEYEELRAELSATHDALRELVQQQAAPARSKRSSYSTYTKI